MKTCFHLFAFFVIAFGFTGGVTTAEEIEFNRDIRPILSDKCYFCHGPDSNTQEAGLRLDSHDGAVDVIESGELIDRVTSDDPDVLMPPPDSKLSLTGKDKAMLREWIDQGAQYKSHWSFESIPEAVALPMVGDPRWCRQTLDRFVFAKFSEAGFEPNRATAPLRWLRRAAFDLTGLPPSPSQIAIFEKAIANESTASESELDSLYNAAAQRMLDSPAFGEHMAVAWLDSARYADSYGYQSDKLNTQWPYRDWVVKAFNDNLPYNQFLTWQLAGDLLDEPTRDQRLATAFNRIHRLNNEGGAVYEEWRIENVADRVHTFGTAVLGLTLECCRCHDHKYDPIPSRDYYSLSAFFNSIDESGVYDRTEKVPCPSMLLPTEAQSRNLDEAKRKLAEAEHAYQRELTESRKRWDAWKSDSPEDFEIPDLRIALGFDRGFDNSLKEIYHPSQSDRSWTEMPELVDVTDSPIARLDMQLAADKGESTQPRQALQLDGERGVTTKGIEPLDRWTPFTVVISMRETKRSPLRSLIAHHTRGTDCGYNGWDLTMVDGHIESRMYRVWPGNAIGVRTVDPIPVDVWHQVSATYDGSSKAEGLKIFVGGKLLETTILRDELKKSCNVKVDHGGEFVIGQRFRSRGFAGGLIDDVRLYTRELTVPELQSLATGTSGERTQEYYWSAIDKPTRSALDALTSARKELVMAEEAMNEIPIMRETYQPRAAHLLARGQYDAPKNDETRVERNTPSGISFPFPAGAPRDRRGLAQWVTDPQHPLTARVAVNRLWGNFFSSPLVRTPENFGLQGELPTHPALLDWLARDFIDGGWNVKRFCKNVVLSATYRQDSAATEEQLKLDPTNRLLARGPAHRLAAEQIRDLALSASGLLNSEIGGPPVSPYQPGEDLWKESNSMSPPYKQSVGISLYRRSLYSVWKRTSPLPNMSAFDTTSREVCTVKRSRTNTPLQALVLLNDVQFVEAARVMAQGLMSIQDDDGRINEAFLRLTGRRCDHQETEILRTLFADELEYYSEHKQDAQNFVTFGDEKVDPGTDVASLAAFTTVCQTILNLDATIWKR
ncbi:Planctomycete cytochrome C [Planctomycetes bacterium CA13]|uniref:Planctomycete cytochrome C n=1 Tax=Novipirellula herctigrandis TaxID=2527986 RepID=A0A5C5Z337_9BACT|nr:Planctomycete cytochrome C [Planctomycetes bacterium CA13]